MLRTSMSPVTSCFKRRYNHHSTTREETAVPESPEGMKTPAEEIVRRFPGLG